MKSWDLVRTDDGHYGLIADVFEQIVFMDNGCEERLDATAWDDLTGVMSPAMNVTVNFVGIETSSFMEKAKLIVAVAVAEWVGQHAKGRGSHNVVDVDGLLMMLGAAGEHREMIDEAFRRGIAAR